MSSLHPPSKLLLGCLASTDLCVGLLVQPLYVNVLLSAEHSKHCYYSSLLMNTTTPFFCRVSLMTLTAISEDRLLALKLGIRYRQVVILRRVWVLVITIWLSITANTVILHYIPLYSFRIFATEGILCKIASTSCYMKIYSILRHHQAQVQHHVHQGEQNDGETPLNIARYRKTVSSTLWVQITLVACYLPLGVVMAIVAIYEPLFSALDATMTLIMLNSTLNPFLYCWKIQEMKQAVMDTIRQLNFFSC